MPEVKTMENQTNEKNVNKALFNGSVKDFIKEAERVILRERVLKFIWDFKQEYDIKEDSDVLDAIQQDGQHYFIMRTQDVDVKTADKIMGATEEYLINKKTDYIDLD